MNTHSSWFADQPVVGKPLAVVNVTQLEKDTLLICLESKLLTAISSFYLLPCCGRLGIQVVDDDNYFCRHFVRITINHSTQYLSIAGVTNRVPAGTMSPVKTI